MSTFIDRLLGREKSSAKKAKDRLKLVLIHDRIDMNPGTLDTLKDEIIEVISRHVEIDPGSVHIKMTQDGRQQRLIADIPLNPAGRRRSRKNV
ncbi:MAG: cell division topological specificity factor MinE [Chloroflexota bacterium]|nr:MAG: cell division topological specificity factor MinE [Chloroflexota bacterium]